MKILPSFTTLATRVSVMAVVLTAVGVATTANAAAPALNAKVVLRPLTPQDIKDYSLTGLQGASGLTAVGVGQPAYLEALVNAAIAPSNIISVTWVLTNKPFDSAAVLTASPLGTNVPTYKMADRFNNSGSPVLQVAGRTLLRPDITGQYTVAVTITTTTSGSATLTQDISGSTYLGIGACAFCHSGGVSAPDKYTPWTNTAHASMFTKAIDGLKSDHYSKNCISCHTAGYDTNSLAVNGGFDDVQKALNWTFPAVLTNGNWASMVSNYPTLAKLANIQCENCHGPGSEHAYAFGDKELPNWPRIGVTHAAGNCAQCHDSKNSHIKNAEWNNSLHARATRTPSGSANRAPCARCHTASGFAAYAGTLGTTNAWTGTDTNLTAYEAITCSTCHDPHDASNPHQLRTAPTIALGDGETVATVTNAGAGALCMNCHQSRTGSYTNSLERYPLGLPTYAGGSSSFGPHDNPAAEMIEGVNGYTYGKSIPSSAHRMAVTDTCVGCHMNDHYSTNSASAAFTHVGGHSFSMSWSDGTNTYENVEACAKCHGEIDSFNMVKVDYNSDGVIEGVQTEVQKLLDKVNTLLPDSTYRADGNYVADGVVGSVSVKTNWPAKFLQAAWNYQLVNNDLSKGVHNAQYAVGLLKASIGNLTGDENFDGLADWWQIQYFGSVTNALASFYAAPAGDGVPNWLKYNLGLDPMVPGANIPGGFVWGPPLNNPQGTNAVAIYTAAEVVFDTQVGTTYQIQSISALDGDWQNVGGSIAGTGGSISYVTPTRDTTQQFFRVVHTP